MIPGSRFRRTIRLSAEGWYYSFVVLFIVGGAVLREVNLLVLLFAMMVVPLLLNWRLVSATSQQLQVSRRMPKWIHAGEPLLVRIEADNQRRKLASWAVVVSDQLRRQGGTRVQQDRVKVIFPQVPPQQKKTLTYETHITQRGVYEFAPLKVSTRFPLGLVRATVTDRQPEVLFVAPRLGKLAPSWRQFMESGDSGNQRASRQQGLLEGDYYGLREWRPGDSRRWIHWRTSAKIGALAVRQFERQRNRDVSLLLDLHLAEGADEAELELLLSFAATLFDDLCRRGATHVQFVIAGEELNYRSGGPSGPFLAETMQALAVARGSRQPPLKEAVQQVGREARPGTRMIVLSTRQQPGDLESRPATPLVWIPVRDIESNSYFTV